MNPEEFQKAESLFRAACELPAEQRAEFVERQASGDDRLKARVLRLLKHDERPAVELEPSFGRAVRRLGEDLFQKPGMPMPSRIGAYRIVRQLGEGGFGVVYLAEQENPRRTVALKVVRWHMASPDALARFEHETQVLGQLQHAGIAQIFEAGVADVAFDTGIDPQIPSRMPYYTMEFIQGRNLLQYADSPSPPHGPLDVAERLELIARVCDALQHAHQNGIIHRDLKPDNILVVDSTVAVNVRSSSGTRAFGAQPKLLDFGVARAMESDAPGAARRTHVGQIIGTPAYMSPEQVRGEPHRVDTRSDVYAVGVLLYQLLAGRLPYEFPGNGMAAIVRVIEEQEPASLRGGTASRGTTRGTRIPGDVEAIVMKALAKDKERRYQSAAELASDIRRFLADEPIEAKRDSALYLLRKNVKRYRGALSFAAGFVVLLAAFAIWASSQARINHRLAIESIHARNAAIAESERANETAERLALEISQSNIERGRALATAGNLLDAERLIWEEYLHRPDSISARWALRELYTHYPIQSSHHSQIEHIRTTALSPDERLLATAGDSSRIEIWDRIERRVIAALDVQEAFVGEICFSLDGAILAAACNDGKLRLWNCNDWRSAGVLTGHQRIATSLRFVSGGSRLLSVGADGVIRAWDTSSGVCLAAFNAHRSSILRLRVHPDGRRIATSSSDRTIVLWDLERLLHGIATEAPRGEAPVAPPDNAKLATLRGHVDRVTTIAFSPDGKTLASSGSNFDRALRIWNLDTLEVQTLQPSSGLLETLCFTADSRMLYGGGWFTLDVFDIVEMRRIRSRKGKYTSIHLVDDERNLILSNVNDIRMWDARTAPAVRSLGDLSGRSVAFLPNDGALVTSQADGSLQLRDAETGEIKATFVPQDAKPVNRTGLIRLRAVATNPTGTKAASVSLDYVLRRWDVATGRCEAEIRNADWVTHQSVAFSPDRRTWAYARRDTKFAIGRLDESEPFAEIPSGGTQALSACFSPDGTKLATTSRELAIRLWTSDGKPIRRVSCLAAPWGVAFSPDSSKLLVGTWSSMIEVFDVASGERVNTLEGHTATVWGIEFRPNDPDVFASCSSDGTIRLWSLSAGRNLAIFDVCPGEEIIAAAFQADGRRIAVATSPGEVRILDLEYADACIAGNRESQLDRLRHESTSANNGSGVHQSSED